MGNGIASERRLIWDLPVRIVHFGLILSIAGAWLSHYAGTQYFIYHEWCGYVSLTLAAFRVLWGFFGTRHARFIDFLSGPAAAYRYFTQLRIAPAGHNPLGGWMIVVLLTLVMSQALTGLFANDQIMNAGPFYGYLDGRGSDRMTTWHRYLVWMTAVAIGIHVGAAVCYLWIKKQDLITPMVTGWKSNAHFPIDAGIKSSRIWLALLIMAVVAAVFFYFIKRAPAVNF